MNRVSKFIIFFLMIISQRLSLFGGKIIVSRIENHTARPWTLKVNNKAMTVLAGKIEFSGCEIGNFEMNEAHHIASLLNEYCVIEAEPSPHFDTRIFFHPSLKKDEKDLSKLIIAEENKKFDQKKLVVESDEDIKISITIGSIFGNPYALSVHRVTEGC